MKGPGYPWSSGFSPLSLSWLGTERKLNFFFVLSGIFDSDPIAGVWFPRQFELLTLAQLLYVSLWCSVSTAPPPSCVPNFWNRESSSISLAPHMDWAHLRSLSLLSRSVHSALAQLDSAADPGLGFHVMVALPLPLVLCNWFPRAFWLSSSRNEPQSRILLCR